MFKIIKTSTYKDMVKKIEDLEWKDYEAHNHVKHCDDTIKKLKLQLHTLTAKKLPIKKSKNK